MSFQATKIDFLQEMGNEIQGSFRDKFSVLNKLKSLLKFETPKEFTLDDDDDTMIVFQFSSINIIYRSGQFNNNAKLRDLFLIHNHMIR